MTREIVFIHGSGDMRRVWGPQIEYMKEKVRWRAEAIDLPGKEWRGKKGEEVEVEDYAEEAYEEIWGRRGMERPVVVGHSLGGAIALMLALEHGREMEGMVLVGTGGRLRVLPEILEEARLRPEEAKMKLTEMAIFPANRERVMRELREEQEIGRNEEARDKGAGNEGARDKGAGDKGERVGMLYRDLAACNRFDVLKRLEEIEVPILIVCGEEDRLTPVKYSQYLQQQIRGADLRIVPEAGHYVMREQAEKFNEVIKEWLEKQNWSSSVKKA